MGVNDSGNGNLLVSQKATLGQAGILRRLSFYVTTAAGDLRLGVYAPNGPSGGPGQKLAETSSFVPTAGWNTVNVLSPITLAAGSYWLAYLPSSSSLGFRVGNGGEARWQSYSYGPMPATFPTLAERRGRSLVALRDPRRDRRGSASASAAAGPVRGRGRQRRGRQDRPRRHRLRQCSRQRRDGSGRPRRRHHRLRRPALRRSSRSTEGSATTASSRIRSRRHRTSSRSGSGARTP